MTPTDGAGVKCHGSWSWLSRQLYLYYVRIRTGVMRLIGEMEIESVVEIYTAKRPSCPTLLQSILRYYSTVVMALPNTPHREYKWRATCLLLTVHDSMLRQATVYLA